MTRLVKIRSLLLGGLFTLLFVGLMSRVYWIQVVHGAERLQEAKLMWETDRVLQPQRGSILDRNGKTLAEDAPAYNISLNPQKIYKNKTLDEVVKGLSGLLKDSEDPATGGNLQKKIEALAAKKRTDYTPKPNAKPEEAYSVSVDIRNEGWKVDAQMKEKIDNLKEYIKQKANLKDPDDVGIYLKKDEKRYYPGENLASQLLGYLNKEGQVVTGLEASLNKYLEGKKGSLTYESDRKGVELPNGTKFSQPAKDGSNVQLTIDKNIQFYIDSALDKVYQKYHPKSVTAIAVDPKTMEVLGMSSRPDFNPNKYWQAEKGSEVNQAISSQYEPGSTFKLVTLAATVEEGLFNPNAYYPSGTIQVPGRTLHDYNVGWGTLTYLKGLVRSSNVAFVKLGYEMLGQDKLKGWIEKFGFGQKTGIDLPGEVPGSINMKYPSEFATATYGQGLTATAVQQVAAYAAMANGGKLMKPYVIKQITDPNTNEVMLQHQPEVVRQVVSEKTAKTVTGYLEQVVTDPDGTGQKMAVDGYRVAGKTGTANIVVNGKYSDSTWVISFIGYAPAEDPRIVVAVIADQPDLGGDFHRGSEVTAPAFKEIMSQSLRYMGVAPSDQQSAPKEKEAAVKVPDLSGMSASDARNAAAKAGLTLEAVGKGNQVISQFPVAGTEITSGQRMYIVTQQGVTGLVPDMTGKSLREALELCAFLGVKCQPAGEGYVSSQSMAGEGDNAVLNLQLAPSANAQAASPDPNAGISGGSADKSAPPKKDDPLAKKDNQPVKKSTESKKQTAADAKPAGR